MSVAVKIIRKLANVGKREKTSFIHEVSLFKELFDEPSRFQTKLNNQNDKLSYRELLTRYLFLNSVLDQGPDMEGVRRFLVRVTNRLYESSIKYLHSPDQFFDNIDIICRTIDDVQKQVTMERKDWAEKNLKRPESYNLFLENARQLTPYILFRWGTPLAVILRLQQQKRLLTSYIDQFPAAETFATSMKSDIQYGLGKAIGNKATHLFVKWLLYTYEIIQKSNPKWSGNSYELPFDSNAGRVLFMSGYIFEFIPLETLRKRNDAWKVFTKEDGTIYIRVTNLREKKVSKNVETIHNEWQHIIREVIAPSGKKRVPVFQLSINSIIEKLSRRGLVFSIGEVDDGLMHVGTQHCFNKNPQCHGCDLEMLCFANQIDPSLKTTFHT